MSSVTKLHTLLSNTAAQRDALEAGRELRKKVPRSSHAQWTPSPHRPDPISLLEESNRSRQADLVPIRYGRMLTSPFAFLRGSAIIMAQDLAESPTTGIKVQACGDAHLSNFGTFATPERKQVFDLNDFDETLPGPWEWDVKRLAASIVVAGRQNGFPDATNRQSVVQCVESYRKHLLAFAAMPHLDVWYSHIDIKRALPSIRRSAHPYINRELERARKRTSLQVFPKLVKEVNEEYHLKDNPPLIMHLKDDSQVERIKALVEGYAASVQDEQHVLLDRYHYIDIAQKIVGIGSIGTRCYIVLLIGRSGADPLILQVKEAQSSVLERHLGPSVYAHQGQRVVCGQRLIQSTSDIFLGWTRFGSLDFYVRQLRDMKLSPDVEGMDKKGFILYTRFCGWALARAHARSGDALQISGYLGKGDAFDRAIAAFASAYADQNERDYAMLADAARVGRIVQRPDV